MKEDKPPKDRIEVMIYGCRMYLTKEQILGWGNIEIEVNRFDPDGLDESEDV